MRDYPSPSDSNISPTRVFVPGPPCNHSVSVNCSVGSTCALLIFARGSIKLSRDEVVMDGNLDKCIHSQNWKFELNAPEVP